MVRRFGRQLMEADSLSPRQVKALSNITQCRTSSMGGHEETCDTCGEIRYSYNSCGDRHCPKCQISKQAVWVEDLVDATLPVRHFHIIFTVPHQLNAICLWDARTYYNALFDSVWQTLRSFGYTHYGVETGAVAILHSWGQNLSLHPHIHCLVPAAGYSLDGEWRHIGKNGKFLYPVGQLSSTFSGKLLASLTRSLKKKGALDGFRAKLAKASSIPWVVHSEPSMADADHVVHYLGQYTHRIAISNQRILDVTDTHVSFMAKDYRDNARQKPVNMKGAEFLRRFCQHIMPERFVRIRRYGIYNHTAKRNMDLQFVSPQQEAAKKIERKIETGQERMARLTGFDPCKCPVCKQGTMVKIAVIPRIRSPAGNLPSLLKARLL